MEYPGINFLIIVSHDETVQPMHLRFVEIEGASYFLARDVAQYLGLTANDDGDYRSALASLSIPFIDSVVNDRGNVFGPVALITEQDYQQFRMKAKAPVAAE